MLNRRNLSSNERMNEWQHINENSDFMTVKIDFVII